MPRTVHPAWWRHQMETFSFWPFIRGTHRSPVNSPYKGQWRGAVKFSLIGAWINGWENDRKAGDMRRHRAYYDVTVVCKMAYRTRNLVSVSKVSHVVKNKVQFCSQLSPRTVWIRHLSCIGTYGDLHSLRDGNLSLGMIITCCDGYPLRNHRANDTVEHRHPTYERPVRLVSVAGIRSLPWLRECTNESISHNYYLVPWWQIWLILGCLCTWPFLQTRDLGLLKLFFFWFCFCPSPGNLFRYIGINMLPSDFFRSNLYSQVGSSTQDSKLCNWLSLWCLVLWINHLPPAC